MKFNSELNKIFLDDSNAYYKLNGAGANFYEFASQFYLIAVLDYSAYAAEAALYEDMLVRPVIVVRDWAAKKLISKQSEEQFTNKIKFALFESIDKQDMAVEEKMATKIQILEI